MNIPSIDLHPKKVPGKGPESALLACRAFLQRCLAAGHREVRIITGLGLRGDGTPRLRKHVEDSVLSAYASQIDHQSYEQGGAVIRVSFKAQRPAPSSSWHRHQRHAQQRQDMAVKETRIQVALDRLDLASLALDEGDLRRFRLKYNQVCKEFGWDLLDKIPDPEGAEKAFENLWLWVKALDQDGPKS